MVYMLFDRVDLNFTSFYGLLVNIIFCNLVCFSYNISNTLTIFGLWYDYKVGMSVIQGSSDVDLIYNDY